MSLSPRRLIYPGLVAFVLCGLIWPAYVRALDRDTAVNVCRRYLASRDEAQRGRLADRLDEYQGEIEPVLQKLSKRTYPPTKTGYLPERHFITGKLRKKHPDDLLYFVVPKSYRPKRPTGLIVFLHGGGKTTSRRAPRATLRFPTDETSRYSQRSGDMLAATEMITVGPSAPWNKRSYYRWCLPESDEYLADVILECKTRFNIDPDRVFLLGHSMGGFGAFHHVQRQPDRFAAVIANSGSWRLGYWPTIRGTPLCIVQGVRDARPDARWHYTDVEYGRSTDKILSGKKIEHVYLEHNGKHGFGHGRNKVAGFFDSTRNMRRDPYYPHVALASPVGFRESFRYTVVHNRWLTLNEAVEGNLEYDALRSNGNGDFDSWRLMHRKVKYPGAAIEAVNRGDNTVEISTENVARFTVWLHPKMVDTTKPVKIVVDGNTLFEGTVKPSLVTALESFERRMDWGLIYPIKIEL